MKKHYAWVIAWTGALVVLLAHGFGRMSYSVILPPMKKGLSLTYTQVGLIGTGNFIGYLCLAVIGGFPCCPFWSKENHLYITYGDGNLPLTYRAVGIIWLRFCHEAYYRYGE